MLAVLSLVFPVLAEDAPAWSPVPVTCECQSMARVPICSHVNAGLRAAKALRVVPRAEAVATVYLNATEVGSMDRVNIRVVGTLPGAPAVFEQTVEIDSRAGVDEQRAALEQPLARALAPFVAVALPAAVRVSLVEPGEERAEEKPQRPWGTSLWSGGWGSWTDDYQYLSYSTGAAGSYVTNRRRGELWFNYGRSIQRQPPLVVEGHRISLETDSAAVEGALLFAENLSGRWTVGALLRAGADDPEGQYASALRAHVGVEHNWFPADDPRGNRVALGYFLGANRDAFNQINTLGETVALFPSHMLMAQGSVKVDKVELGLELSAQSELLQPLRRYEIASSTDLVWRVGGHVDIDANMRATKQAIPGPATVDASSYEAVSRSSYAQPLEVQGSLSLRVHWDPTNGAQNNRFYTADGLGPTSAL